MKTTLTIAFCVSLFSLYSQSKEMAKFEPFTGKWNLVETIIIEGDTTINKSKANLYFTKNKKVFVVDEIAEDGNIFRGLHSFNSEKNFYNNYSVKSEPAEIGWSHYNWNSKLEKFIWYEGELIDSDNPWNKNSQTKEQWANQKTYFAWYLKGSEHITELHELIDGKWFHKIGVYSRQ